MHKNSVAEPSEDGLTVIILRKANKSKQNIFKKYVFLQYPINEGDQSEFKFKFEAVFFL